MKHMLLGIDYMLPVARLHMVFTSSVTIRANYVNMKIWFVLNVC